MDILMTDALDLINRQKVELDALKADIVRVCAERDAHICTTRFAKAEAVKEFAARLKAKSYPFHCAIGIENAVTIRAIDDLVKEMVGEGE